ncbi:alginate biosynthesis protein AlgX [uncultured Abyssibacter sp.]|uniref:alginate O-acetyltransferase AlgX-related protein n=1 Tax=uncultured Abyssibacter sp. TaxID=2320202 RepID=UPI0032B301A5
MLNSNRQTQGPWLRGVSAAAATLLMVVAAGAGAQQAPAFPELPKYELQPCCNLCPEAADPASYTGYLDGFRMMVQGDNGWLFRTEDDLKDRYALMPSTYQSVSLLQQRLAARGVTLVMLPLPPRGLMAWRHLPDHMKQDVSRDMARVGYQVLLQDLRDAGAVVPRLGQLLYGPQEDSFYFKRDHHWTPSGAKRTALQTAERIRELDAFADIPAKTFTTRQQGILRKSGTYAEAVERMCGFGYPEQVIPRFTTSTEGSGSDLFGDADKPQIVLAGTSNSDPAYNFAGFLAEALGVDVLNVSVTGGGIDAALLQYFMSEDFRESPPKILIWEMPVYSNFDEADLFRQILPSVDNGCEGDDPVMQVQTPLKPDSLTETLFNGDGKVESIHGGQYLLDVRLNRPDIDKLHFSVWYMNGKNDNFTIERSRHIDTQGRFVITLREGEDFTDAVFMGLDLGPDPDVGEPPLPEGTEATVTLCERHA